jgi:2-polyprenyl-6-methoxyphenol hydroxylase-like FAD-dependent oxidoreductase
VNVLRIAIIGYGIAGIAAAIGLLRLGHRIEHFEAAVEPGASGAGLLLHPPALALLNELAVDHRWHQLGASISRLWGENSDGRCIMDFDYGHERPDCFAIGIQRRTLFNLLCEQDSGRKSGRTYSAPESMAHADLSIR